MTLLEAVPIAENPGGQGQQKERPDFRALSLSDTDPISGKNNRPDPGSLAAGSEGGGASRSFSSQVHAQWERFSSTVQDHLPSSKNARRAVTMLTIAGTAFVGLPALGGCALKSDCSSSVQAAMVQDERTSSPTSRSSSSPTPSSTSSSPQNCETPSSSAPAYPPADAATRNIYYGTSGSTRTMVRGEVDKATNNAVMDEVVIATSALSIDDCKNPFQINVDEIIGHYNAINLEDAWVRPVAYYKKGDEHYCVYDGMLSHPLDRTAFSKDIEIGADHASMEALEADPSKGFLATDDPTTRNALRPGKRPVNNVAPFEFDYRYPESQGSSSPSSEGTPQFGELIPLESQE